jgi:hypothetical protein
MAKKKQQKSVGSGGYLELEKSHKDWYEVGMMGKQRGKPKAIPPKNPKKKGEFSKHHHK